MSSSELLVICLEVSWLRNSMSVVLVCWHPDSHRDTNQGNPRLLAWLFQSRPAHRGE